MPSRLNAQARIALAEMSHDDVQIAVEKNIPVQDVPEHSAATTISQGHALLFMRYSCIAFRVSDSDRDASESFDAKKVRSFAGAEELRECDMTSGTKLQERDSDITCHAHAAMRRHLAVSQRCPQSVLQRATCMSLPPMHHAWSF